MRLSDEKAADAAGLQKVAFTVEAPGVNLARVESSRVRLEIDYAGFADSYGGDWAGRLQIVQFPSCWLDRPNSTGCGRPVPIAGAVNDRESGVISVEIDLLDSAIAVLDGGPAGEGILQASNGTGYGLLAGASSATGNYAATSLNAASSWSVEPNTGNFSWSYPMEFPAPPAGAAPSLAASYSSQAIDGLTNDENTQGGLLGPGWSMSQAFIERSYKTCSADGWGTNDLCYIDDNAQVSMAGVAGRLIPVSQSTSGSWETKSYKTENHVGWRFDKLRYVPGTHTRGAYGADNDREYWRVTDLDGTLYYFGLGKHSGEGSPSNALGSVDTVPVRGLVSGRPCYSISSKWCHQAYRWKLDRVEDAQGRITTYRYTQKLNKYGRLGSPGLATEYVAGSVLSEIEYGQIATNAHLTGRNTHRIVLRYGARCNQSTCPAPTTTNGSIFPDIPNDRICTGTYCTKYEPVFFNPWMLLDITAQTRTGNATSVTYSSTAKHVFQYQWVQPGGGPMPPKLFLRYIQKVGLVGTDIALPKIRFDSGSPLDNRVDYNISAGVPRMRYFRVDSIIDELGGQTKVTYGQAGLNCASGWSPPGGWAANTRACFARYTNPVGGAAGFGIYHKYVVERVDVYDQSGPSPTSTTSYTYSGGMGWHSDHAPYREVNQRSWADYRGFSTVRVVTGATSDPYRSRTEYKYHRGLHDDIKSHSNPSGPKRVEYTTSTLGNVLDHNRLKGLVREVQSLNVSGSTEYSGAVHDYQSTSTPSTVSGGDPAWQVELIKSRTRSQGSKFGRVDHTYDTHPWFRRLVKTLDYGRVSSAYGNIVGDDGSDDHFCTAYSFTPHSSRFIVGLPHRTALSSSCSEASVISDRRQFYDDQSGDFFPAPAPTTPLRGRPTGAWAAVGDATSVVDAAGNGVEHVYERTTWEPGTGYGGYFSRPVSSVDARGFTTSVVYRQRSNTASDTPPNLTTQHNHNTYRVQTKNAKNYSTYTYHDSYGRVTQERDLNWRPTYACYDALDRTTKVFLPGDTYPGCSATTSPPSMKYVYAFAAVAPKNTSIFPPASTGFTTVPRWSIETTTMDGAYGATTFDETQSWTHLDGLGRVVETQTPSPTAGRRILTKVSYDTRGNAVRQSEPYSESGTAGASRHDTEWSSVETATETVFDPMNRVREQRILDNGTPIRNSHTTQGGYYVTTRPMKPYNSSTYPYQGDTQYFDARGNNWRHLEYHAVGGHKSTYKRYNLRNELISITDADGNLTSMTYNDLGLQTSIDEPNAGKRTTRYFEGGQTESTVDAHGQVISTDIDPLGRPTETYVGSAPMTTDRLLTRVRYDATGGRGQVHYTQSYQPAGVLASYARVYGFDPAGRVSEHRVRVDNNDTPATSADNAIGGWFTFETEYSRRGKTLSETYPGVPGTALAAAETVSSSYTSLGRLSTVASPLATGGNYIASSVYDSVGRPTSSTVSGGSQSLVKGLVYQPADGRLLRSTAKLNGSWVQDDAYTYDSAGNPTAIRGSYHSNQECFEYDSRQRLKRAFNLSNASTLCPTPGSAVTPNGASPYLESYAYDGVDRFTNNAGRTYSYDAPSPSGCAAGTNTTKPHAPEQVTAGAGHALTSLTYDCNGAATSQTTTGGQVTEDVQWVDVVGVTPGPGSSLSRDVASSGYNASAVSAQEVSGDGGVTFQFDQPSDANMMIGLAKGPQSNSYTDIDYAIHGYSNGGVYVRESGLYRGKFIEARSADDVFEVRRTGAVVTYHRNGVVFYTSTVAASGSYVVDTSFQNNPSSVSGVQVSYTAGAADPSGVRYYGQSELNRLEHVTEAEFQDVEWTDLVGATPGPNSSLVRDSAPNSWAVGGTSTQSIVADGEVSFRYGDNVNSTIMVGLAKGTLIPGYGDIDFAIYSYVNGNIYVFESGTNKGFKLTATASDVFTVKKVGEQVSYLRNGDVFYQSTVPATGGRYFVDTAMYRGTNSINSVRIAGAVDTPEPVTWTSPVGVTVAGDNSVTRGGTSNAWNASIASEERLDGDGELSFRFGKLGERVMVGLDESVGGSAYSELDFALYQNTTNGVEVRELGTQMCSAAECGLTSYSTSDVWTIRRYGSQVDYLRNGEVFYTSTRSGAGSYLVDTSFNTPGAKLADVELARSANKTSRNLYDAAGQRIMRVDPDGSKTLYLGKTEVRWDAATGTMQASRYYPGGTMRTFDGSLMYTTSNHQGSTSTAINANTGEVSRTLYKPYGEIRSGSDTNDKAFLGQTNDTSQALAYLNNRHYDPTTGVFVSVDPLVTMTGEPYIYGSANPVTISDPSGLCGCEFFGDPRSQGAYDLYGVKRPRSSGSQAHTSQGDTWSRTKIEVSRWSPNAFDSNPGCEAWCTREQLIESAEATAGFFPYAGEAVDSKNCVTGDGWSCAAIVVPFVGGKILGRLGRWAFGGGDEVVEIGVDGTRGLSDLGGLIEQTGTNAAGGRIFTSTGAINQNDFAAIVDAGLYRGDDVHIFTGAHGLPSGQLTTDASLLSADVARFGDVPGVHVHDLPSMSATQVRGILNGPGTIIGGFCDSGACLAVFDG